MSESRDKLILLQQADVIRELERQIQELHARADDYCDVLIESESRLEGLMESRRKVIALRQGIAEVRELLEVAPGDWGDPSLVIARAHKRLGELLGADAWMADVPSEDGGQTFDVYPEKP